MLRHDLKSGVNLRPGAFEFSLAGSRVILDPAGALFAPSASLLAVADLHMEKGSSYARRGIFLPPWDTGATLDRLSRSIAHWRPRIVCIIGDSFHDSHGYERMTRADRDRLKELQRGLVWIWIAGNHDPVKPTELPGEWMEELVLDGFNFRHSPSMGTRQGEIAGHLHPIARVAAREGRVRRRCFVTDSRRCILPAFGALAGGLNIRNPAFDPYFVEGKRTAFIVSRDVVYSVAEENCVPD